jgi:hypothetical protein
VDIEGENHQDRPVFLRCADRTGREIVIYQDRWYEHIMVDHKELSGREEVVRATLEQPDTIRQDRYRSDRECYYRQGDLPARHRFVKVVVKFSETPFGVAGTVITAFTVERIDHREAHLW